MTISKTKLEGCFIIEPQVFEDERGFFYESYNKKRFEEAVGKPVDFVQDNLSRSTYGVIRGLHYQKGKYAQSKLVSVIEGAVLDIAVDLRKASSTFGQSVAVEVTAKNKKQVFVPKGFAHGFSVLSKTTLFSYKCDAYYNKDSETGIIFNDHTLAIDWKIPTQDVIINAKDKEMPTFNEAYYF